MFNSPIDEIKSRLDIVEVISQYIKLQKCGVNFRALCPFHSEKKPSFFVSPARQIWHCFGCNAGGSIFDFVMKIEGIEFGDALRILAQKAGVELKPMRPELQTQRQRLYEICELATRFFERQLEGSSVGREAKKYLLNRGIKEESIKKWRLGYAPDSWQGVADFLIGKGYKMEEIEKAGLVIKSSNIEHRTSNNYFDRFRGRIIFPIFDLNSQVIGFGGRIFRGKEDEAKYINTPNTLLYDKSRVLYGLDKAKLEIRKKDFCILAEGYTDVIMCHQAGFENVVATSGTALTPYQLRILRRYSENLLTAFDMDIAGDTATKRGIDLALAEGFEVKVIAMPKDSDPCDIIFKNPENWAKLVKEARSILDFYFETTFSRFDKRTPQGKKEISKVLLPVIKKIQNKIVQAHWIQELSKKMEVKEETIEAELKRIPSQERQDLILPERELNFSPIPKSRRELLEERILSLIFKYPPKLTLVSEENFAIFSQRAKNILENLKKDQNFNFSNLSEKDNYFLDYLFLKSEIEEDIDPDLEIQTCLLNLQSMDTRDKLNQIALEIEKAEKEGDSQKVADLIKKFNQLANQLNKTYGKES